MQKPQYVPPTTTASSHTMGNYEYLMSNKTVRALAPPPVLPLAIDVAGSKWLPLNL
jgi:hypothetical protein